MKRIILFSALALLLSTMVGCEKEEKRKKCQKVCKYPSCMQRQIDDYLANNIPSSYSPLINKYSCNGKMVYSWEAGNPDGLSYLITLDCDTIGEMGGIDGRNTCKCNLEYIETVWKDNRKKQ